MKRLISIAYSLLATVSAAVPFSAEAQLAPGQVSAITQLHGTYSGLAFGSDPAIPPDTSGLIIGAEQGHDAITIIDYAFDYPFANKTILAGNGGVSLDDHGYGYTAMAVGGSSFDVLSASMVATSMTGAYSFFSTSAGPISAGGDITPAFLTVRVKAGDTAIIDLSMLTSASSNCYQQSIDAGRCFSTTTLFAALGRDGSYDMFSYSTGMGSSSFARQLTYTNTTGQDQSDILFLMQFSQSAGVNGGEIANGPAIAIAAANLPPVGNVPEPSTTLLAALGVAALIVRRRSMRRR